MDLKRIFGAFSRRHPKPVGAHVRLTDSLRHRVLMLCSDALANPDLGCPPGDYRVQFWKEIHERLTFLLGRPRLSGNPNVASLFDDVYAYLLECSDEHFLDFIEFIFQTDTYSHVRQDENGMVEEICDLFAADEIPYAISPFVRESKKGSFFGRESEVQVVAFYPRVIPRDNEFSYSSVIKPAITLLLDEGFSSANAEFIEALEDYRKGDYGDSLTKCASSLESTMKIICDRRGWPYDQTDTAASLLHTIVKESGLESYFEQPLLMVATIRNRLSKSHGSGTHVREVPKSKVSFAINMTASAILLLVQHSQESGS